MKRRDFSRQLAGTGLGLAVASLARAQQAPIENQHFVRLSPPVVLSPSPDKKVQVVEFFGYWCPHCNAFEGTLDAWLKRLPADVQFKRVPVAFAPPHQVLQKAFYALEEMGQIGTMHKRLFSVIHYQGKRLQTEAEVTELVGSAGLDVAKFRDCFNSFGVSTRISRARQLAQEYKIDGVPALGVQGRFYTSGSLAGSNDRMVAVADFLIQSARDS